MMTFDIAGKTALVTGANRGIGRAFVECLIERGAGKIYAASRDQATFAELSALDASIVEPVLLDVTRTEHVQALSGKLTGLDLLVNNAGIVNMCFSSSSEALKIAQQEMATNYFGPLELTLALLPLLKQSRGCIVNISSIAGISNFPSIGPYSATKAALHSLTQGLRTELRNDSIMVAGVYPGPIDTRMTKDFELEKAPPSQVARRTIDGIHQGKVDIFPDDFSEQMYATFLNSPGELESAFAAMHT